MPSITYSYADVPTILRFSESCKFIRGLMGPFGSGKSSGCVWEIFQLAMRQPVTANRVESDYDDDAQPVRRSRYAVVRNTYRQLADTTIKTWLDWFPDPHFGTYAKSEHNYLLTFPLEDGSRVESEIMFRALDRPDHVSNLLSLELTGCFVNEAREIAWAIIKALQGRVGRYPAVRDGGCVDAGLIMDTNPPPDDSWWYKLFEEERPDNAELFKQPSGRSAQAENLANLPKGYYDNLMKGSDAAYITVYVDGQYGETREGKPVYPEYADALHCVEVEPVKGVKIIRGWDFGLTPACIFTQVLPDGRWLVFDELIGDDISFSTFADCLLEMTEQRYEGFTFEDYGDPTGDSRAASSEETCYEIARGKGIKIRPAEQNVTIRLESVRKPLNTLHSGKPQFQIHPRCEVLRKGFLGRYQYKRVKVAGAAARYHDEPDKNEYSHPHDGLQYAATHIFGAAVRGREEQRRNWSTPLEKLYPKYAQQARTRYP